MGFEKGASLLEDLIEKAGGCAVMDGGFATQLESHGASINDPLWSALCLIKDPHLIKQVPLGLLSPSALSVNVYIAVLQMTPCQKQGIKFETWF